MVELGFLSFSHGRENSYSLPAVFRQYFKIYYYVQKTQLVFISNRKNTLFTRLPETCWVSLINDIYLLYCTLYLSSIDNSRGTEGIRSANRTMGIGCLSDYKFQAPFYHAKFALFNIRRKHKYVTFRNFQKILGEKHPSSHFQKYVYF